MVEETSAPDDVSARSTTTAVLTLGAIKTDNHERPGDIDWFEVRLEEDKEYRIALWPGVNYEGMYYETDDGQIVKRSLGKHYPDHNGTDLAWVTASSTGAHFVAVKIGFSLGEYSVRMDEIPLPDADMPDSMSTDETIIVGESIYGRIDELDDVDWIRVNLNAGKTYRIRIEGSRQDQGTLHFPISRGIYDSAGTIVPGSFTLFPDLSYHPPLPGSITSLCLLWQGSESVTGEGREFSS